MFLLREVECAHVMIEDVSFPTAGTVRLELPVSKSDPQAKGTHRELECICGRAPRAPALVSPMLCAHCVLRVMIENAPPTPPDYPHSSQPLFATADLQMVSKRAMIKHIEMTADSLELRATTAGGTDRWGGHAWRRGGVQWYAAQGLATLDIKYIARHSSSAIEGYLEGCDRPATATAFSRAAGICTAVRTLAPHMDTDLEAIGCVVSSNVAHRLREADKRFTRCSWYWYGSTAAVPHRSLSLRDGASFCKKCGEPETDSSGSASSSDSE